MTNSEEPSPAPATPVERVSFVLFGASLLFVFRYHLVSALVAGLLVHAMLSVAARLFHGPRVSHGAAKVLSALAVGLVAAGLTTLTVILFVGLLRGHIGDLPTLLQRMAEVLEATRGRLGSWGLGNLLPEAIRDTDDLQLYVAGWLREHGAGLKHAGGAAGHLLLHAGMGIVIGLLVFFHRADPAVPAGPLPAFAAALSERIGRFAKAFRTVISAQVEISLLNTALTAIYLFGILPLSGNRLPLAGTLLAVTFVTGLIPVVGNLISNTVIVILSLGVSPWVALSSLVFLVFVHKLEYFVNARIVGSRIQAAAWEILLAIIVFEVAFGVPGVVLAPVVYAWVKGELRDRGLV